MKKTLLDRSPYLKKSVTILIILLIISLTGFSQNVGISPTGTIPPDPAAGLDVNFTNKGILIPRVALTSTTSFAPLSAHIAGMIIYNTATVNDVTSGYYYDNGTKWMPFFAKANAAGTIQYWDGANWVDIPAGLQGQTLQINGSGIPTWVSGVLPTLTTVQVSTITSTSASSGGIVLNDGGSPVTAYGVCWATTPTPTTANSFTSNGTGIGSFTSNITGLTTATTYYVRAYATTINGTGYGNVVSFTTP